MMLTNCPNCGAPLTSEGYCEYCNTKARYANEVECSLFSHGAITDVALTEIMFKFKADDGTTVVLPFYGKPVNIEIEYYDYSAVNIQGNTLLKCTVGPPTVRIEIEGTISKL